MSLQLAIYFTKEKKYELEIFKFKKKVSDVQFLKKDDDTNDDFIVSQARKKLENKG
jgi:hypothetical protein